MNVNAIQNLSSVASQIMANRDVENFVCSSAYFIKLAECLDNFLKPLPLQIHRNRVTKFRRKGYIGGYSSQPPGCDDKPLLLFSLFHNEIGGNAVSHKWIARLPLSVECNVPIYFPDTILNDTAIQNNLVEIKNCTQYDLYNYAIPININDFMNNPADFLDLEKIQKWITDN
jgi:hypothetical protein